MYVINLTETFKFSYETGDYLKKPCFTPGLQIRLSSCEMELLTQHYKASEKIRQKKSQESNRYGGKCYLVLAFSTFP